MNQLERLQEKSQALISLGTKAITLIDKLLLLATGWRDDEALKNMADALEQHAINLEAIIEANKVYLEE